MTTTDSSTETRPGGAATRPPFLGGVAPYLLVDRANAAADFYVRAFGAEDVGRMPVDAGGRTMHCHLLINGGSMMLSDPFPNTATRSWRPRASAYICRSTTCRNGGTAPCPPAPRW